MLLILAESPAWLTGVVEPGSGNTAISPQRLREVVGEVKRIIEKGREKRIEKRRKRDAKQRDAKREAKLLSDVRHLCSCASRVAII